MAQDAAQQIVVTATRSERLAQDTPQAVNIVTSRMISERNVATLPDALAGESGVLIQKSNTGGGSPFIRGLTGKQVLILIDGVRVNNSYFRFGPHQYLNTIDSNDIDRVEVVHGPTSVLYGTDALAGVINVITRNNTYASGEAQTQGLVALRAGSADSSLGGRARVEYRQGDLSVAAGVSVKRFGDLRGGEGVGLQVPTAYNEQSGNVKLSWRLAPNHELTFMQQLLNQDNVPKTNEVTLGTRSKFEYEPQLRTLGYLAWRATDLKSMLADEFLVQLSYSHQREGERIVERATPTVETQEITDIATPGLNAQFNRDFGKALRLRYGFEMYQDTYDTQKKRLDLAAGTEAAQTPGTPNGAKYETSGVFAQAEWTLGDAQFIPGIRYARFKADGQVQGQSLKLEDGKATASVSALYRLTSQLNLVGSVAQGYRAPNMEDFFGRVDFVSEIPNTTLKPESSLNREIGLKFAQAGTAASAHYFVSTYDNLIARATVSPGVRQRQNLRRARITGLEGSLSQQFGTAWNLRAALASVRGEDEDTGNPLQRIPPNNGSLRLRYAPDSGTWFEVNSLFAARQDRLSPEDLTDLRIPAGGTPGYATLGLGMGLRWQANHELVLTIENLTNKKYKTHGSGVYGAGASLAVSYTVRL
jgi:TonB-dependent heme/hemoglobin receptor